MARPHQWPCLSTSVRPAAGFRPLTLVLRPTLFWPLSSHTPCPPHFSWLLSLVSLTQRPSPPRSWGAGWGGGEKRAERLPACLSPVCPAEPAPRMARPRGSLLLDLRTKEKCIGLIHILMCSPEGAVRGGGQEGQKSLTLSTLCLSSRSQGLHQALPPEPLPAGGLAPRP